MTKTLKYIALLAGATLLTAQPQGTKTYATPEEARDAIVQAAAKGMDALKTALGPGAADIMGSGDEVQDKNLLADFNRRLAEKVQWEPEPLDPSRLTLLLGNEEWPFPVPLLQKKGRWYFDVQEGKIEIRNRVIGGHELNTINVCRGYVEAQQMYAEKDWNGNGFLEYAQKIASTEGKKDGLYWPGEDSPVAEAFAKAAAQGYSAPGSQKGYHGYAYRVLLSQGPDAADGERDYVVHGMMIGGFALVAWPVQYGISGIMTFIVNQDGIVYEKDLGAQTGVVAKAMKKFNPDKSWTVSPSWSDVVP